jgi:hypothetical protein
MGKVAGLVINAASMMARSGSYVLHPKIGHFGFEAKHRAHAWLEAGR